MSTIEQPSVGQAEILKKYPASSFIEGAYKDIQKATATELEALKKKYEKAVKDHEESVSNNRTSMFSDLLSEVEARRKSIPAPESRTVKVQRLKKAIEGQNGRKSTVDVGKILRDYREKSKDIKTPITIDLADDIRNDPFWKNLEAYMFKFALQDGKYFLCVQEKGDPKGICVVEFNQEEYDRRISKEVPVRDRVGKTYGIGEEIRIGI